MKRPIAGLFAGTLMIIAGSYGLRATLAHSSTQRIRAPSIPADPFAPQRSNRAELERLIRAYEAQVHDHPNETAEVFLAQLYLDRARMTGDVGTYAQAQAAVEAALRRSPTDAAAQTILATLRYTTHDFAGALALASREVAQDPSNVGALALVADARMELGDVGSASAIVDRLARSQPGTSAVDVRRARIAFLKGDTPAAAQLAGQAEREAVSEGAFGVGLAWYRTFRAQVAYDSGDYATSAALDRSALGVAPDYHVALFGLARARAAAGDTTQAIELFRRLVDLVPQPDYVAALGDLYAVTGDRVHADEEYQTVQLIGTLARINAQLFNRQLVIFDADHSVHAADAVRLAAAELRVRKDIYGYDAYAWALYADGRAAEARSAMSHALSLGTRDAKLLYHAGMIAAATGDRATARSLLQQALAISPSFDLLQAGRARTELGRLGAEP